MPPHTPKLLRLGCQCYRRCRQVFASGWPWRSHLRVDWHRTQHTAVLSHIHVVMEGFVDKVKHGVGPKAEALNLGSASGLLGSVERPEQGNWRFWHETLGSIFLK